MTAIATYVERITDSLRSQRDLVEYVSAPIINPDKFPYLRSPLSYWKECVNIIVTPKSLVAPHQLVELEEFLLSLRRAVRNITPAEVCHFSISPPQDFDEAGDLDYYDQFLNYYELALGRIGYDEPIKEGTRRIWVRPYPQSIAHLVEEYEARFARGTTEYNPTLFRLKDLLTSGQVRAMQEGRNPFDGIRLGSLYQPQPTGLTLPASPQIDSYINSQGLI